MQGYSIVERLRTSPLSIRRSIVAFICLTALVVGAILGVGWQSGTAASPRLVVEVPEEVLVGEPIDLRLIIHDANGISGFDTTIVFDTNVATLQSVRSQENDLASLGQDVRQLGPFEVPGGVAVGAYTCPFKDCTDVDGKQRSKHQGKGTYVLSALTLVAEQPGPLTIDLSSMRFADGAGRSVEVDLSGAIVTVNVVSNGSGE